MRRLITFCLILTGGLYCFAQKRTPGDTARLHRLHITGENFIAQYRIDKSNQQNLDRAFQYFNQALLLSQRLHLDTGYGKYPSLLRLGEIYLLKGDTTNGVRNLKQVAGFYHARGDQVKEGRALYSLYENISPYDNLRAIKGFAELRLLFTGLQQNNDAVKSGYDYATLIYENGHKAESERICLDLIKQFKAKHCPDLNRVYLLLSNTYRYEGNSDKALQVTMEGIDWANNLKGESAIVINAAFYGELGLIYQDLGQTKNSVFWYRRTIEAREKIRIDQRYIFRTAGFMIQGLIKLHRTSEGLNYLSALVKRKPPLNDEQKAEIAQIKAYCYDDLKQFKLAEQYFKTMLRLSATQTSPEILFIANYDIAAFYVRQQQYREAAKILTAQANTDKPLSLTRDVYLLWFKIDSAQGNMLQAIKGYQLYKSLNDSIFNLEKSKQVSELEIKYASDQKENDIRDLKKERLLQVEKAKQANKTRNWILVAVLLLSLVLGILYHSFRLNKKKSREIDLKNLSLNDLIAEKDELLQEKEWLIKEIHHRVKNNLQIVMSLLQRQSSFINNKEALTVIRDSEQRMHSIALIHQKLYQSDSLMLVNMIDYIHEMVGYLQECFDLGAKIRFEKQIRDIDIEVHIAVPLGLILNEAITNAIKYAFKDDQHCCIWITLEQTGDNDYMLEIRDSGAGLPADFNIDQINSMGFNLMRGLSKQLGGKLELFNQDGLVIRTGFHTD